MRIAFASIPDPDDISAWSGTIYHMYHGLKDHGVEVIKVGPLTSRVEQLARLKSGYYQAIRGLRFDRFREPAVLRDLARQISAQLRGSQVQAVISPSSLPLAYLGDEVPKMVWTDATFGGMQDFYPEFSNLARECERKGNIAERRSLGSCAAAIYSSDWAADSARDLYDVPADKLLVVPFGPNIECLLDESGARRMVAAKPMATCDLLFLGVDWERKGGPLAFQLAEELNRRGVPTRLLVAGCEPPIHPLPSWVETHGFISKRTEDGRRRLIDLLLHAHFLVLPSQADCTPCVFSEASAYALPVLTTAVGGIPSVVRDGVNGRTFPLDTEAQVYAEVVSSLFADPRRYRAMALASYEEYRTRLNWPTAIAHVVERLELVIAARAAAGETPAVDGLPVSVVG